MGADQRDREQHVGDKVAIARRVERIGGNRAETERFLQQDAVHGETGARERTRPERHFRRAAARVGEPLAIADERPGVREQHVGPPYRLRALAVGVTGQDRVEPVFRFGHERAPQGGDRGVQLVDRAQRPEAQVRGDLVVTGAARVQLSGDRADLGVEQALDEGVHVFIRRADRGAIGELVGDAIETAEELRFFTGSHDAGVTERVHPRLARGDILRPEPVIDGKAAV